MGSCFCSSPAIERADGCPGSGDESLLVELSVSKSLNWGVDAGVEPGVAGVSMSMGSSLQLVSDDMLEQRRSTVVGLYGELDVRYSQSPFICL